MTGASPGIHKKYKRQSHSHYLAYAPFAKTRKEKQIS